MIVNMITPRGNDYNIDQIKDWYEDEKLGYFDLVEKDKKKHYEYGYTKFNRWHMASVLDHSFDVCLALGAARGEDVAELNVEKYIAIEPAKEWWSSQIAGKPAEFREPNILGNIDLDNNSVDIATSFGVLHHIPNVGFVLGEMIRVLKPGGYLILREPISSMGDHTKPRPGLTKNERGLPKEWLLQELSELTQVRMHYCQLGPLLKLFNKIGVNVYSHYPLIALDKLMSHLLAWNDGYYRTSIRSKFAPGSIFYIGRKPQ